MSTLLKTRKMYLYLCVWSVSVHVRCVQVSVVVKRGHQVLWGWSYRWFVLPIVGAGNQALVLCKSRSYSYPPSHLRSSQLLQMALTELFQRPKSLQLAFSIAETADHPEGLSLNIEQFICMGGPRLLCLPPCTPEAPLSDLYANQLLEWSRHHHSQILIFISILLMRKLRPPPWHRSIHSLYRLKVKNNQNICEIKIGSLR